MSKKYAFPEPSCRSFCEYFRTFGGLFDETRYCMKSNNKKGKRFKSSDPVTKPPRWCPRRLSPPICRIYIFKDESSAFFEMERLHKFDTKKNVSWSALEHRYKLRSERPIGMNAKQFFAAVPQETVEMVLDDLTLEYGNIIEIDDGLRPYYFIYLSSHTVVPVTGFDAHLLKKE